jgi:outer membrane protein
MKRNLWIVTLLLILFTGKLCGQGDQKKWTLKDCINYALTNNIGLQRQKLQTEADRIYLTKSKMDMLPDLNFNSSGRVGFGRSIDPVTNLITFKQNLSNSYSLSSSITLFNGFTTLNTIAANKFMLKAGVENEKIAKNTLIIDILGGFYQVIYAKGLKNSFSGLKRVSKPAEKHFPDNMKWKVRSPMTGLPILLPGITPARL